MRPLERPHPIVSANGPISLIGRVRRRMRARHLSPRTEETYVMWIKRFVRFSGTRHSSLLCELDVTAVLTREDARAVIAAMRGVPRLAALVMYGAGLRLMEALTLGVKDLDLDRLLARGGGGKGGAGRASGLSPR